MTACLDANQDRERHEDECRPGAGVVEPAENGHCWRPSCHYDLDLMSTARVTELQLLPREAPRHPRFRVGAASSACAGTHVPRSDRES